MADNGVPRNHQHEATHQAWSTPWGSAATLFQNPGENQPVLPVWELAELLPVASRPFVGRDTLYNARHGGQSCVYK